jgi:RNA-directed DNA polymerase
MLEAYDLTRKDGAAGIDGVTATDYEANLEANLLDLLERIKSGRYEAPPVRRVYISKADGSQRPLGIPTFEDKVAQRAVSMVLEAIYEQDYLPCSYGFRPGRSAHQALNSLQQEIWSKRLYWVLELDIRKYFDSIPHTHLRAFLDQRVTDGVIRRMIDKWLNAGAVEDGFLHRTTDGTPQGGVVSPCILRSWRLTILSTPNVSWRYWASVLSGTGSRSIPTRHGSLTSAQCRQTAHATRTRVGSRLTF